MPLDARATACLLSMVLLCGCKRTPEIQEPERSRDGEPTTAAMTAPPEPLAAPTDNGPCTIKIPQDDEEVPVFPNERGLRVFSEASAGAGDEAKMAAAMHEHRSFFVSARTPCLRLGESKDGTKVRITAGPLANQEGWVASEWTQGK